MLTALHSTQNVSLEAIFFANFLYYFKKSHGKFPRGFLHLYRKVYLTPNL